MKKFLTYFGLSILTLICLIAWSMFPTQGPQELAGWLEEKIEIENGDDRIPFHDDGRIDFLTLLNQKASGGVTVNNNLMVDVYLVSRPKGSKEYRESYENWLGNPGKSPEKKIEELSRFLERVDPTDLKGEDPNDRWILLEEQMEKPWIDTEIPLAAKWLDEQNEVLNRIVTASKKTRYYSPMLNPDGSTGRIDLMTLQYEEQLRIECRMLKYRCFRNFHSKDFDSIIKDVMAIRRISMRMRESLTLFDHLFGIAIAGMANRVEKKMIMDLEWTPHEVDRYCKFLETMKEPISAERCSKITERFQLYDLLQNLARKLVSEADLEIETSVSRINWVDVGEKCEQMIQWQSDVLSVVDPVVAAEGDQYKNDWYEQVSNRTDPSEGEHFLSLIPTVKNRTEKLSQNLVRMLSSAAPNTREAGFRVHSGVRATYLALKLEKHRFLYGQYPKSLAEINCSGFPEATKDYYTGNPIHYQRLGNLPEKETGYWFLSNGPDGQNKSCDSDGNPKPQLGGYDDVYWRVVKKKVAGDRSGK